MTSFIFSAFGVLLIFCHLGSVLSYGTGAGSEACVDLTPQHGNVEPQNSPAPFDLGFSQTTPDTYSVTLSATAGEQTQYRGLLIQARMAGTEVAIGSFTPPDGFRPYSCQNGSQPGVTHSSSALKNLPATFQWTPPADFSGMVQFHATVVREFQVLWTNFQSPILEIGVVNQDPEISCPAVVSVVTLDVIDGNLVNFEATCNDPEDGDITPVICTPGSGSFFSGIGDTLVTCICTDSGGASASCGFTVTITDVIANQNPVVTCPMDTSVVSRDDFEGNFVTFQPLPSCVDAEDGTINPDCTQASGSFFIGIGDTDVTCTCTDGSRASDTCGFTVTIRPVTAANDPPAITCPTPITETAQGGTIVSWDRPGCTDPNQNDATLAVSCSPMPNTFFPVGTRQVTCTCTDNEQASDQCTFTVTVQPSGNPPPVITCPAPITEVAQGGTIVSWDRPGCTDPNQDDATLAVSCSPMPNTFFPEGTRQVTCTCTDNGQLSDQCTFTVIVQPPGAVCASAPCGANECRPSGANLAGYTCHSLIGDGC